VKLKTEKVISLKNFRGFNHKKFCFLLKEACRDKENNLPKISICPGYLFGRKAATWGFAIEKSINPFVKGIALGDIKISSQSGKPINAALKRNFWKLMQLLLK